MLSDIVKKEPLRLINFSLAVILIISLALTAMRLNTKNNLTTNGPKLAPALTVEHK